MAINRDMEALGKVRSAIRDLFEYGNQRAAAIGRENVFDYSLGNPSVAPPQQVTDTMLELLSTREPVSLHGYTSAQGDKAARTALSDDLNRRFGLSSDPDSFYITCGAAASLTITLKALSCPGDEFMVIAPFFPEYRVFIEMTGSRCVVVPPDFDHFQINREAFQAAVNEHTKGVILNSPNNPSGAVFSEETIREVTAFLKEKEAEYGHQIFLISDEPYRELVYDGKQVPFLTKYYEDTIVCYSFSKSLSLPGERIGYIYVSEALADHDDVYAAVAGAGRALGYVCAPSLLQKTIAECVGLTSDLETYRTNRDLLYNALTEYGYSCVYPDGAFYLFFKAPMESSQAFCEKAKEFELLLVPADSFGCPGYVRISYCVSTDMVRRSLPAFKALMEACGK